MHADGVRCARVRWEINFLLTFETAQFFCVYPVYIYNVYAYTYIYAHTFLLTESLALQNGQRRQ